MINHHFNRNLRGKLCQPARMIDVVVGKKHKIQLFNAGKLRRGHNAIRVAPVAIGPAGIDQQGLPFRSHKKRRLSAFDVHKVNLQRFSFFWPWSGLCHR